MAITLGFLASVLIILPGLVGLAVFNLRAGEAGARRPEQSLTSISALVVALLISLLVHLFGFMIAEGAIQTVQAIVAAYPMMNIGLKPVDPLEAFYNAVARDVPMPLNAAIGLAFVLIVEVFAVVGFVSGDTLELALDRVDLGGRGWVFQHVTRPAEHGFAPIGHVFTSVMNDGQGIAYKGSIIDLRQNERGEVLSVALARPERFLYALGSKEPAPAPAPRWPWQKAAPPVPGEDDMGIVHLPKDYVGGVVALDAKVINNIVVHNVSQSLLDAVGVADDDPAGDQPA